MTLYDGRCLVCGGRGHTPTAEPEHDWVPATLCPRCKGSGIDPSQTIRDALAGTEMP